MRECTSRVIQLATSIVFTVGLVRRLSSKDFFAAPYRSSAPAGSAPPFTSITPAVVPCLLRREISGSSVVMTVVSPTHTHIYAIQPAHDYPFVGCYCPCHDPGSRYV